MDDSFSKKTAFYACIPFIFLGLYGCFSEGFAVSPLIELFIFVGSALAIFVLLAVGWVKNFPRWSLPAIGFCLFCSFYMADVAVPVISRELLGLWAWLPLAITIVVAVLIKPSLEPVKQLFRNLRKYPFLIFFVLFGFTQMINFFICDEINSIWLVPLFITNVVILTVGQFVFLTHANRSLRNLVIITSFSLSILLTTTFAYVYWREVGIVY